MFTQQVRVVSQAFYRAVDHDGQTLELMLAEHRNLGAARLLFMKIIASGGALNKIVIDKSGANLAGAQPLNNILLVIGSSSGYPNQGCASKCWLQHQQKSLASKLSI